MEVTDKQMIESAKVIKKGCDERKCGEECPFLNLDDLRDCCCLIDGVPNSWFIPSLNPKLSDAEKVVLGNLDHKYKWITRDENGCLCIYGDKPYKRNYDWSLDAKYSSISVFPNLFQWCKWEDEEPWYIPDLLKGE